MNLSAVMRSVEESYRKKDVPAVKVGDKVKVQVRIKEGDNERLQAFGGTVIAIAGKNLSRSITVRHISHGVGVERIFPLHAPAVASIEVQAHHKVRRSKLYYLRGRSKRSARLSEQRDDAK